MWKRDRDVIKLNYIWTDHATRISFFVHGNDEHHTKQHRGRKWDFVQGSLKIEFKTKQNYPTHYQPQPRVRHRAKTKQENRTLDDHVDDDEGEQRVGWVIKLAKGRGARINVQEGNKIMVHRPSGCDDYVVCAKGRNANDFFVFMVKP